MPERNVIIIGSGPSGLTAAIYASRASLKPLLVSGIQPGGQLMMTTEVENYPGFPKGILGPELMRLFREQAERFGTEFVDDTVTKVDFSQKPFKVTAGAAEYSSKTVIIATGASSLWLGLPKEQQLIGHGVSSCATCDGFFFRGKDVVVVGGGDSACEDASFLTKFANSVTIVHRRDVLKATAIMADRVKNNPKIYFIWNSEIAELLGEDRLTGVKIKNVKTGEITEKAVGGMFVAIGHKPNTEVFKDFLELDQKGYIKASGTRTSIEGVFVGGDVHDHHYRQAITAAGFGCMAAIDTEKYLHSEGSVT